ncbi:MAG: RecJ [uncultured Rubrobacteraceae bacterium]|uniref:Single-stranded-DNA-specific exonuclease RecJ n=1 Tax=uncultured Rubrobacteraceae bacterium TaxID=349277 RepID=A0A6J4P5M1_9ACTN|nr:MAG: RecJ [uncultured Rubrobacteraceae bacterium]
MARWRLLETEADVVSELARVAELDPLCARVLANRGVSPEGAPGFLSPSLKTVGAPSEEAWRVAARRVVRAIKDGERIGVFGDYDTDGLTSAATLYLALSRYTNNLVVQLPTRQTGYGLLEPYVRDLFAEGVDLIVTADCGISNRVGVEVAGSLGMDVIVTDHHIPPEDPPEAPPAVAVLDPKLWDPEDPLAGVGVAWKLAWAVARELEDPDGKRHIGRLLDLVSIGTIVDIAPLVGDNRALASMGLRHMNRSLPSGGARPGIEALAKVAGVRGELDEGDLGWKLGPRLNSIGRIKNPRPALDLLLTNDKREAMRIASLLNQLNSERQHRTRFAVERALAEVDPEQDFKIVVTDEGSAGGLAGLVAGRVAGATGRPAAILNRRADGSYGGSARSGETDVDLHGALFSVRHLLGEWGGHRKAAGLSVEPGNFDAFVAGVNQAVRAQIEANPDIFDPPIEVDAEVSLGGVSNGLLDWHERLAPFGSGNYRPVFVSEGLRVEGARQLWEGMNLLRLGDGVPAKLAGPPEAVPEGAFDAAYTVSRSAYTGAAELEIVDWRKG